MTTQNRELASLIDNSGNVTATGNLTVSGTTTTISSTVQTIADPLIEINTGAGSNSNDLGFVFERGSTGDNATLIWDESADAFAVGTTTATGTSTGNMSYTTGDFLAGKVTVDNVIINGTTIGHTDDTDLMTLADGGLTVAGTIAASGVVTANAGVHVDGITIDGTEIDLSSGDLTLDVAGDIILDADGADVKISDGGTHIGTFTNSSSDFVITSAVQDKDIIFKGDDNGSAITALTLDMSDAGKATFSSGATFGGGVTIDSGHVNIDAGLSYQWGDSHERIEQSDGNLEFFTNNSQAMTLSGSNLGIGTTSPSYPLTVELDQSADWLSRIYNTGTTEGDFGVLIRTGSGHDGTMTLATYGGSSYTFVVLGDGNVGIGTTTPNAPLSLGTSTSAKELLVYDGGTGNNLYSGFAIDSPQANAFSMYAHDNGHLVFGTMGTDASTITERMRVHNNGYVSIGTSSEATNSKLNVSGGIRYTWNSTGHGLNNVSYQSFNNSNVANSCGNVYYKVFIVNIYHNNGSTNVFGISNGGGGVGYNFTCLRPDTATPVHGQGISFSLTTIGSSAMTFNFVISSGGGALTIERTSGTGTFYVSVHNIAGT